MNKSNERDFFDSPNMITYILIGLLVVLIILSQSFAIQSHMEAGDIFRSIINHNSVYLVSLIYFVLIKVKFGKKYFDYLNVTMFVFYLLTTFASLFTIFQSFGFYSILNLAFNVLITLYFGYSFFTSTVIGKDLGLSDSPLSEINNGQYYYILIGIIAISLIVSLVSVNSFEDVVVYLLEAMYQFMFVRYVYLYKEYIERKELEASKEKKQDEEKPKEKRRGRPKKNRDEETLK
jgi:membrane protein